MLKDTTGFDVIEMLKGFGASAPVNTPVPGNGAIKEPARTGVVNAALKDESAE
jgi:hypothetical protein